MKPIISNDRIQTLGPHPEERRIFAARLEGWPRARPRLWPSFETRAQARAPQDEAGIDMIRTMETLY